MNRNFDDVYMEMAASWGSNSYSRRKKVGALIVKDNMIISDGYNGTPPGFDNNCEYEMCSGIGEKTDCTIYKKNNSCEGCQNCVLVTRPYVLHAEANAITKLATSMNSSKGSTLYVTLSPCLECSKLIIQSGIKRVVYNEEYRETEGIELLRSAGIEVVKI